MTREELNECKEVIDDFFGKGSIDSLLHMLGVNEDDLIDKEEETVRVLPTVQHPIQSSVHVLPSEKLDNINKKLELHKLVQEYVTEENISNDDYAKLFEFACWIINR